MLPQLAQFAVQVGPKIRHRNPGNRRKIKVLYSLTVKQKTVYLIPILIFMIIIFSIIAHKYDVQIIKNYITFT